MDGLSAALGLQQTGGYATLLSPNSIHNFGLYSAAPTIPRTPAPSYNLQVVADEEEAAARMRMLTHRTDRRLWELIWHLHIEAPKAGDRAVSSPVAGSARPRPTFRVR